MIKPPRRRRSTVLLATLVLAGLGAASCGSDDVAAPADTSVATVESTVATTDGSSEGAVMSAAEGAAARAQLPSRRDEGSKVAASSVAADGLDVGIGGSCGVYEPTPEEIASTNENSEALAAEFDRFGVSYTRIVDDYGFLSLDYDPYDLVAQSVSDSFWTALYPVEPIPQEQLDEVIAQNDVIAAALDDAGVTYTRTTDESGYENLDYDYEDPTAQAAVDAAYNILYPPQPPDAETLERQATENAAITAALDAAGVTYEVRSDELGWSWVEWDFEDQAANDAAYAVYDELYPPIAIDPIEECFVIDDAASVGEVAVDEVAVEEVAVDEVARTDSVVESREVIAIEEPSFVDDGLTAEVTAQRDAEATALADGFTSAGVTFEVQGESPWQTVIFDLTNDASVGVVRSVLDARG